MLEDDNGITCFEDDLGVTCWDDDVGQSLCCGAVVTPQAVRYVAFAMTLLLAVMT